ncbi:MAG: hypothetical protein K0R15_975 [Clostridiales bacterium]|jgi:hypothetical protein|nr:hypothetical protein [Clostridiales bacterium]
MLYFIVFLHDYVTTKIIVNKYVSEIAYLETMENKEIENKLQLILSNQMILCTAKSVSIEVDKGLFDNNVKIVTVILLNTPFNYVNEIINGDNFEYTINTKTTYLKGKNLVIPIAAIDELSSKVTQIGDIKKKYLDEFNKVIEKLIEGGKLGD